jgi:hypothetical protein
MLMRRDGCTKNMCSAETSLETLSLDPVPASGLCGVMQRRPDTTRRLVTRSRLDSEVLERLDLCARRVEQELNLGRNLVGLEVVDAYDLVAAGGWRLASARASRRLDSASHECHSL